MIKVTWPMNSLIDDVEVCDWLEELIIRDTTISVFELGEGSTELYFFREDDAIAFRLRFGL